LYFIKKVAQRMEKEKFKDYGSLLVDK